MANKKNKRHHRNGHRHVFWSSLKKTAMKYNTKRIRNVTSQTFKIAKETNKSIQNEIIILSSTTASNPSNSTQSVPNSSTTTLSDNTNTLNEHVTIEGSRIINIEKLGYYINDITKHSTNCGGNVTLIGEKRYGLASVLCSKCSGCGYELVLESSTKVKGPSNYQRWECNLAANGYRWRTHSTQGNNECSWSASHEQELLSANREGYRGMVDKKIRTGDARSW